MCLASCNRQDDLLTAHAYDGLPILSEGYGHDGPGVCLVDGQTKTYLKDMDMTGLGSAWAMARWRPKEYRHKVNAATRCSGVWSHTSPELSVRFGSP